jgi:hypothetical protein
MLLNKSHGRAYGTPRHAGERDVDGAQKGGRPPSSSSAPRGVVSEVAPNDVRVFAAALATLAAAGLIALRHE